MAESEQFRVGGSVLRLFQVLTFTGFGMSGFFVFMSMTGRASGWGYAGLMFLSGLLMLGLCIQVPGVLTITEEGLEVKRRFGTQRLRWSEVRSARWSGHEHALAAMAEDDWQLWIDGSSNDKPVMIVLTGPSVEKQARARELLAARLPPSPLSEP